MRLVAAYMVCFLVGGGFCLTAIWFVLRHAEQITARRSFDGRG